MTELRTRWLRIPRAFATSLIVVNLGLPPTASGQSNLPQHYYLCKKDLMVGGKLNTYITGVNWADQDFTADKLNRAPEAYGKAFMRYLIETYKPDDSSALESETYNWGDTCSTSWPWGREGLEQTRKYTLSLGLAVEVDWSYATEQTEKAVPPPEPEPAAVAPASESVTFDCDGYPGAGGFRLLATYVFVQGNKTPAKAAVTINGRTTELRMKDHDDATGWTFASHEMALARTGSTAAFYRGSKASNCVAR
jgi:hypothetical protein